MKMFSIDDNNVLQQIKIKMDEILKLIQVLPHEAKQFVKNLLIEKIHDIFINLDTAQSSSKSVDNNGLKENVQSNNLSSLVNPENIAQGTTLISGGSDLPEFTAFKIDNASELSTTTLQTEDLPLDGDEPACEQLHNQYLIQGISELEKSQDMQILGTDENAQKEQIQINPDNMLVCNPFSEDDMKMDEATQQLMDEIDDMKPKSNMPFIKEGTPDTTYTTASEDVSSLLSFLPQLSPYIQLDLRDGNNVSEKEGYIHLTVERADGSVQNLKIAATTALEDPASNGQEKKVKQASGDKKLTLIQKHLMDRENNPFKDLEDTKRTSQENTASKTETSRREKGKGRPRKKEVFRSKVLENGQKIFFCKVCQATAQTQYAMEVHMRRHSGEKPFSCEQCGKSFTTKGNLKNHMVTHKDDKPWMCSICQKTFKENRVLVIHQRTHTGERPYKCTLCDKSFTQSGVLKEHLLVHSGQKPHLCDLCGQGFRGLSSLRAHKLRHLQKKAFKCDKCDMDFICQADLNRHDMTHTGARPFMCSLCPKSFTRLNYLKEHLNVHYGDKPYSCKECSAAFPDSLALHRHKRKHKTEKDDANKTGNQTELQTQLIIGNQSVKLTPNLPGFDIMQQTQFGDQSFHMVLNENASIEDIQKLQLLIASSNNAGISTGQDTAHTVSQPVYQVMCMNPDTQEIVEPAQNQQVQVEGQSAYLSAINMLANATNQQYSFSIQ